MATPPTPAPYPPVLRSNEPEILQRFPRSQPAKDFRQTTSGYRDKRRRATCKVGIIEGEMGARIYPKNCVVRNFITVDEARKLDSEAKFTKSGFQKSKVESDRQILQGDPYLDAHVYVALGPNALKNVRENLDTARRESRIQLFTYDTGAMNNSLGQLEFEQMMGMTIEEARQRYPGWRRGKSGGVGGFVPTNIFPRIPLTVKLSTVDPLTQRRKPYGRAYNLGEQPVSVTLTGNKPYRFKLLGLTSIELLRQMGVKLSSREALAGRRDKHATGMISVTPPPVSALYGQGYGPLETHLRGIV